MPTLPPAQPKSNAANGTINASRTIRWRPLAMRSRPCLAGIGGFNAPNGHEFSHKRHWVQVSGVTVGRHLAKRAATPNKTPYGQR